MLFHPERWAHLQWEDMRWFEFGTWNPFLGGGRSISLFANPNEHIYQHWVLSSRTIRAMYRSSHRRRRVGQNWCPNGRWAPTHCFGEDSAKQNNKNNTLSNSMTSNDEIEYVIIYLVLLRLNERSKIVVAVQCLCDIVPPPSKKSKLQFNIVSCISSVFIRPARNSNELSPNYLVSFTHAMRH